MRNHEIKAILVTFLCNSYETCKFGVSPIFSRTFQPKKQNKPFSRNCITEPRVISSSLLSIHRFLLHVNYRACAFHVNREWPGCDVRLYFYETMPSCLCIHPGSCLAFDTTDAYRRRSRINSTRPDIVHSIAHSNQMQATPRSLPINVRAFTTSLSRPQRLQIRSGFLITMPELSRGLSPQAHFTAWSLLLDSKHTQYIHYFVYVRMCMQTSSNLHHLPYPPLQPRRQWRSGCSRRSPSGTAPSADSHQPHSHSSTRADFGLAVTNSWRQD